MPECSGAPIESRPASAYSRLITASCAKVPPAPPYSSGMPAHNRPASPSFFHAARSIMPASFHRSTCGTSSAARKRRACSSSTTRSSLIQAGRGRLRMSMVLSCVADRNSGEPRDDAQSPCAGEECGQFLSSLPGLEKRPHESRSHIYDSLGEGDRMASRCAVHERSVRYLPSVFDRNARLDRHPIYVPCRPKSPQCPQGREVIKRKPPSPRHAATFASNEGFKVERHSRSAVLTLNERFPQRFHLHLIFLQ